ncbi:MAG: hypothetical protein HEQ32_05725 [Vampirovibrio sp.]
MLTSVDSSYLNAFPQKVLAPSPAVTKQNTSQEKPEITESIPERIQWFRQLESRFASDPARQNALRQLLYQGALSDQRGDDQHSTLYYLQKRLNEPCLPGLDAEKTVGETLDLLTRPDHLTQNTPPLSPLYQSLMLSAYLNPTHDTYQQQPLPVPTSTDALAVKQLNTCAVTAEVARLADQHPKEVARLIYEASAPSHNMHEKLKADELFPTAPILAEQVLQDLNLDYKILPPQHEGEVPSFQVSLPVPTLGTLRAMNAQDASLLEKGPSASGAETLLETALLYNFSAKSYDAGTDQRDSLNQASATINQMPSLTPRDKEAFNRVLNQSPHRPDKIEAQVNALLATLKDLSPQEAQTIRQSLTHHSAGLSQEEQLMMERIMEDQVKLENVSFQQIDTLSTTPNPQEATYQVAGYTQPFSAIKKNVISALQSPLGQILANVEVPNSSGTFTEGHVLRILGTRPHPSQPMTVDFKVHDTAMGQSLWMPEAQLIPRIHHITEIQSDAEKDWQGMHDVSVQNVKGVLSPSVANDIQYPLSIPNSLQNDQKAWVKKGEAPEAYHKRVHQFREKQAQDLLTALIAKQVGPSQNKTENAPVQWGATPRA